MAAVKRNPVLDELGFYPISSLQQKARTSTLADRYLAPPVDAFPLMAYRQAEAIVEAGYRHACDEIARWNSR